MGIKSHERKERTERIRNAFSSALKLEMGPFKLKGRGYEPRTTLKAHISRLLTDLGLPYVSVVQGPSARHYYPLKLVSRAAQLMNIDTSEFTSTINVSGKDQDDQQNEEPSNLELFC
jgi:hypothetical protein